MLKLHILLTLLFLPLFSSAQNITIAPENIIQGDPVMITIDRAVKRVTFDNTNVSTFTYNKKTSGLIPISLTKKPGDYIFKIELKDGRMMEKTITVKERKEIEAPLGIPEKLGGNTTASQNNLVSTLSKENASLENIKTDSKALWSKAFKFPLKEQIITDPYGYNRKTGEYTITHKGTDFRAKEGTKVMAMNAGVVRSARIFSIYGNTIVVDHGLGLQTFYMHLSKINVKVGDTVRAWQIIGLSGQTGYAESPHLHTTVRINGISIDPMRFMEFFK